MISALFFTEKAAAPLSSQPIHSIGQLVNMKLAARKSASPGNRRRNLNQPVNIWSSDEFPIC